MPTIWGLRPVDVHDRYWAAHQVQVVRPGQSEEIVRGLRLFLLAPPERLVLFQLEKRLPALGWLRRKLVLLTVWEPQRDGYRESVTVDGSNRLLSFQRSYAGLDWRSVQIGLTRDAEIARRWKEAGEAGDAEGGEWAPVLQGIPETERSEASLTGSVFDSSQDEDLARCVRLLVRAWKQPDIAVDRALQLSPRVWADREASVDPGARFGGAVWVGAGRRVDAAQSVRGPAVLWDESGTQPQSAALDWDRIRSRPLVDVPAPRRRPDGSAARRRPGKRLFDILFALFVLLLTLPLFPLICLAIWREDGRPFFFGHRRETLRGRQFPCWKFRSMRRDAEAIKAKMMTLNQVDGPQFFIENDPRLTRVGRYLRKSKLDELPQLFNVLLGHMSIVGPRPSPYDENQYCPAWREARLSVRPGITGLWQIKRTRAKGLDFQEWIKFDIEYVEHAGWRMDLWILWRTLLKFVRELW